MKRLNSGFRKILAGPDLAIDLGTANTRLYASGRGIVAEEPSVLADDPLMEPREARAGGVRNSNSCCRRLSPPVQAGVVVDIEAVAAFLAALMGRARRLRLIRPRALLCTPSDASGNERAALVEAARRAGASVLAVYPEPLAAALGAGLNPESPYASMVVDIGSGVTDIAVICSGRIIYAAAVRTACSDLQSAVARAVALRHEVWLYPYESERLMREAGVQPGIGPASSRPALGTGPDGLEATAVVGEDEIHGAMAPIVETIVTQIDKVLRDLPALSACEVIEDGILLTGGGAFLRGMAEVISAKTHLDVRTATDPLRSVIYGAAQLLPALSIRESVGFP